MVILPSSSLAAQRCGLTLLAPGLQEVGKENLFVFGVDADDVPRLREERKNFKDYDPRWTAIMDLLLSGKFGDKEYFQVSPLLRCFSLSSLSQCSSVSSLFLPFCVPALQRSPDRQPG